MSIRVIAKKFTILDNEMFEKKISKSSEIFLIIKYKPRENKNIIRGYTKFTRLLPLQDMRL